MTKKLLQKIKPYTETNPKIRGGQLVFKNTRVPVTLIVDHLNKGWTPNDITTLFPDINKSYIQIVSNIIFELSENEKSGKNEISKEQVKISWLSYT